MMQPAASLLSDLAFDMLETRPTTTVWDMFTKCDCLGNAPERGGFTPRRPTQDLAHSPVLYQHSVLPLLRRIYGPNTNLNSRPAAKLGKRGWWSAAVCGSRVQWVPQ
jgi:hypothetical protein